MACPPGRQAGRQRLLPLRRGRPHPSGHPVASTAAALLGWVATASTHPPSCRPSGGASPSRPPPPPLQFTCQQINCTRDSFGNVVDGKPDEVHRCVAPLLCHAVPRHAPRHAPRHSPHHAPQVALPRYASPGTVQVVAESSIMTVHPAAACTASPEGRAGCTPQPCSGCRSCPGRCPLPTQAAQRLASNPICWLSRARAAPGCARRCCPRPCPHCLRQPGCLPVFLPAGCTTTGLCSRRGRASWVKTAPTTRHGGSCARCSSAACTTCSEAFLWPPPLPAQLRCKRRLGPALAVTAYPPWPGQQGLIRYSTRPNQASQPRAICCAARHLGRRRCSQIRKPILIHRFAPARTASGRVRSLAQSLL